MSLCVEMVDSRLNEGGRFLMAYMAHPFGGDSVNVAFAGNAAAALQRKYKNLAIISPLHNFSFLDDRDLSEEQILTFEFLSLAKCDLLILCKGWRTSRGCCAEFGFAMARGLPVYEFNFADAKLERLAL